MTKNKKSQRDVRGLQPGYQPDDRGVSLRSAPDTLCFKNEAPLGFYYLMILVGYAPVVGAVANFQNRSGFFSPNTINNPYMYTSSTAEAGRSGFIPRI